jgi:hypothetical protein
MERVFGLGSRVLVPYSSASCLGPAWLQPNSSNQAENSRARSPLEGGIQGWLSHLLRYWRSQKILVSYEENQTLFFIQILAGDC